MRWLRLAGMTAAVAAMLAIAFAAVWMHPARLPTYRAPIAGGGTPVVVAQVSAEPHGWWDVCTTARMRDAEGRELTVATLLPDTWSAEVSGVLKRSLTGHAVELRDSDSGASIADSDAGTVDALLLDLSTEHGAARGSAWTDRCGEADVVVAVRQRGGLGG